MKTYVAPLTEKQMLSWLKCICASGGNNNNQGGGSVDNVTQNPITPGGGGDPQG